MNIHIMPIGKTIGHLLTAFKEFRIDRLILISSTSCKDKIDEIHEKIGVFDIEIEEHYIDPFVSKSYADIVEIIVRSYDKNLDESFYVNITGGTNLMAAASLTGAHFIGASVYYILDDKGENCIIDVPIVKFTIKDALTKKQKQMLKTLHREIKEKGIVKNISDFANKYGTYKQQVMHYISELERLNLIKVDKSKREHILKFTETGELIIKMV